MSLIKGPNILSVTTTNYYWQSEREKNSIHLTKLVAVDLFDNTQTVAFTIKLFFCNSWTIVDLTCLSLVNSFGFHWNILQNMLIAVYRAHIITSPSIIYSSSVHKSVQTVCMHIKITQMADLRKRNVAKMRLTMSSWMYTYTTEWMKLYLNETDLTVQVVQLVSLLGYKQRFTLKESYPIQRPKSSHEALLIQFIHHPP